MRVAVLKEDNCHLRSAMTNVFTIVRLFAMVKNASLWMTRQVNLTFQNLSASDVEFALTSVHMTH